MNVLLAAPVAPAPDSIPLSALPSFEDASRIGRTPSETGI